MFLSIKFVQLSGRSLLHSAACSSSAGLVAVPSSSKWSPVFRHPPARSLLAHYLPPTVFHRSVRQLSTRDIFLQELPASLDALVPPPPVPVPKLPIAELARSGKSVLEELELWSWWKPSSWLRWALEYTHFALDMPWWGTIVAATVVLRVVCLPVPINIRRLIAKQAQFSPELKEFNERINKAKREGNNPLVMQIIMEQKDFMHQKDIKVFRQLPLMLTNGAVFMAMFFALKRLANVKYPGFQDEGLFWFRDLSVGDPFWVLPAISAVTLHFVFRGGLETGSLTSLTPLMKYGVIYGFPAVVFLCANQFSSAVCIYWVTSNAITLFYSLLFRNKRVQQILNLPPRPSGVDRAPSLGLSEFKEEWKKSRAVASVVTLETLKKKDMEQFRKAGRGKPLVVRAKERLDAELDGINRKQQQREKNAEGSAEECGERSKQN